MPAIFPSPAGGMTFEKVAPMKEFYGNDVGLPDGRRSLHRHPGPPRQLPKIH